jgi:hypothetical protein
MDAMLPLHWLGTTREHYILLFGAAGSVALITGLIGGWVGAYLGARRAVRSAARDAVAPGQSLQSAQLAQLGQMVEAIAIEVERVSEGQRFTTRLLADRMPVGAAELRPRAPGVITPH